MRVFLDSSALAKRYLDESGTATTLARCREAQEVFVCVLALPEAVSMFCRLRRESRISQGEYRALMDLLSIDMGHMSVVELDKAVLDGAIACLEGAALRAADAIHIACALSCAPDIFLSADQRQCAAARQFGLNVEALR